MKMNVKEMFRVLWLAVIMFILVNVFISCSSNNDPIPSQEQLLINKWWTLQTESRNTVPYPPIDLQLYFDENGWCTIREATDFIYAWRLRDNLLDIGPSRFEMMATLTWMTLRYNAQDSTGMLNIVLYFE